MTFSFSLLGALLLLLPGFGVYFGLRHGEEAELISPRPASPNSHESIFLIVLGAVLAHLLGALAFGINELVTRRIVLIPVDFPNPYREILAGHSPADLTSLGIAFELLCPLALTALTFQLGRMLARWPRLKTMTYPQRFGWLRPVVEQVQIGRHLAIGYVRTRSVHDGCWIGYEGLIRKLATNEDQTIRMVVLEQVDRFLVKIDSNEIKRIDSPSDQIVVIQLGEHEIADFAIELVEYPEAVEPPGE